MKVLAYPSQSPDLNMVKNMWKHIERILNTFFCWKMCENHLNKTWKTFSQLQALQAVMLSEGGESNTLYALFFLLYLKV